jgi:hypothetical protein
MRRWMTAVVLAGAMALPAAAQETPEAVMERYYDTFRTGDYAANAALMDPAALEELRETMAGMAELAGGTGDAELMQTFGVRTAEELRTLAPAVLYERMLRATLGDGEMREILAAAEVRVLGHVPEGADRAHVVYRMRMSFGGVEVDQVQVAPLVRTPEGWRVQLTGSLAGLLQGAAGAVGP